MDLQFRDISQNFSPIRQTLQNTSDNILRRVKRGVILHQNKFKIMKELTSKLMQICDSESIFLDSNISLNTLARMIGTNRTYLSVTLRDELHTNFHEFINTRRVRYAVDQLRAGNYNIKEIMYNSGFNSYNSFRNAFYAIYHCTPGEYQNYVSSQAIA